MEFRLPYYLRNCGDGSAALELCESIDDARRKEEQEDEPFGESSVDSINLKLEGNQLFYWDYEIGKGFVWKPVPLRFKE